MHRIMCTGYLISIRTDLGANTPVRDLVLDVVGERIIPYPDGVLCVPSHPHEHVEWGLKSTGTGKSSELRVVVDQKVRIFIYIF
jgi:hypothetical protein